ncbi:Hpt domain-containing protein [Pedobacter sp. AW1-32]|uniref:Hpt domain-containing protein n=1 Tax=Pedobacter sp. AW1-32 TaxID=3383026 RepID=UPI003FEDCE68
MEQKNKVHPLDLSYLIAMVGNEPKSLLEVFNTFIARTPCYIQELDEAIITCNWSKAATFAHKIKPVFGYIGRTDLSESVLAIELEVADQPSVQNLSAKLNELKFQLDGVFEQLRVLQLELEKQAS